jgi:2-(1,2-epoxy-1,2-dihydrophenyl)acetyl-CoA isomerase
MGKPVIAAVNCPCAGAALGIALACDLRIAHPRAYFVVGFSGIGLAPDSAVSLLLPISIGLGRAQQHFYFNKPIPAWRAYYWGMVNQIGWLNFDALVKRTAESLASGPGEAFALGKQTFNRAMLPNLEDVLNFEGVVQNKAGKTEEHQRMVKGFFERRKKN